MTVRQRWCMFGIVALAFLVRVWALDFKPAHFDEGVNGAFVDSMRVSGAYHYDPANYHGPLHFYVLFAGQQLFGRSLWTLRMPTALIGTGVVLLMLGFRRFLPFPAVALAALFVALSPGMIFYSRYAIHEMWLPFFALLACYGGFGMATRERTSRDLWWVGLGLTGMVLTKETYLLHFIAAFLAVGALWLFERLEPKWDPDEFQPLSDESTTEPPHEEPHETPLELPKIPWKDVIRVWAVCLGVLVAFYSGFGFHWEGVGGVLQTFGHMQAKGTDNEEGHHKEMLYWVKLLAYYEWPALLGLVVAPFLGIRRSLLAGFVLMLAGVTMVATDVISLSGVPWERRDVDFLAPDIGLTSFGALGFLSTIAGLAFLVGGRATDTCLQWLSLYGLASFAAYTFIPYKTPWCSVNFLWPFCFAAGYVLHQLAVTRGRWLAVAVIALVCAASVYSGGRLNFIDPTRDALAPTREDMPEGDRYAYVQTTFDIQKLLRPVRGLIAQSRTHRTMRGLVLGESFPLIWELNDLPNIVYHEPAELLKSYDADFLIVPDLRREEIESQLVGIYYRESFQSRGGTDLSWLYLQAARFQSVMPAGRTPEVKPRIPLTL